MLFNSLQFLLFFPTVTLFYFLLPHRFRWFLLLAASCIFYCAFIPVYIFILLFTIVIDYFAGIYIHKSKGKRKKTFLIASLVANIGILCVFKYNNFFIDNVNTVLHALSLPVKPIPFWNIILPLGLSFHTFQAMSYTIEVYRGNQAPERHFGIYALYVMFYPQLVAGPIERPQNIMHQYHEYHRFNPGMFMDGLRLMLWGLFKKIVIADRLVLYVDSIFADPSKYHSLNLFLAVFMFSIQIYCDFSGYSDIAIGCARTMGFNLMTNFNRPYFSRNIQEFWAKWHISLSTWFRDYLYIPLGGNRVAMSKILRNVVIVFLVSGLWHGANWTFLVWGAIHACFIVIYLLLKNRIDFRGRTGPLFDVFGWLFTFGVVTLAWIFFRAENIDKALLVIRCLLSNYHIQQFSWLIGKKFGTHSLLLSAVFILVMAIVERFTTPGLTEFNRNKYVDALFCSFVLTLIISFGVFTNNSFIYFQF